MVKIFFRKNVSLEESEHSFLLSRGKWNIQVAKEYINIKISTIKRTIIPDSGHFEGLIGLEKFILHQNS